MANFEEFKNFQEANKYFSCVLPFKVKEALTAPSNETNEKTTIIFSLMQRTLGEHVVALLNSLMKIIYHYNFSMPFLIAIARIVIIWW